MPSLAPPVGTASPRGTDIDMKSTIPLLVLWACNALSEPLDTAMQRRSDRFGVYASDYTRNYRKASYVAIPLHSPVPVLHVLSSAPLYRPNRGVSLASYYDRQKVHDGSNRVENRPEHPEQPKVYAASMSHAWLARPPRRPLREREPDETASDVIYARPKPAVIIPFHDEETAPTRHPTPLLIDGNIIGVETVPAPEVLYARPNPQGGYFYSRKPTKKRPSPVINEPLIIRVHKHRVVKDRR